jgi:hypothetical protein
MSKVLFILCMTLYGLLLVPVSAQSNPEDTCPTLVAAALSSLETLCSGTSRNQACYGHFALTAAPQPDVTDFRFAESGDRVDVAAIQSLKLSGLDTTTGSWGVVLMQVQANLPGSLPGQNVTMLLFGDTEIRNAADSAAAQTAVLPVRVGGSLNANVRLGPNTNEAVLGTLAPGVSALADGRLADNTWVRVQLPDETGLVGWVFSELLVADGSLDQLPVIAPGSPRYGPMQAFYLNTRLGGVQCSGVPQSGLLIQTPQGAGQINLSVNDVQIRMGSTVVLRAEAGQFMTMKVIEGAGRATAGGRSRTALAGSQIRIPLDEELNPIGEPSEPESYDLEDLNDLPLRALERDITVADPLDEEAINRLIEYGTVFDSIDLADVDALLAYLLSTDDADVLDFLINELNYRYLDAELAAYFDDTLDDEDFDSSDLYGLDEDDDAFSADDLDDSADLPDNDDDFEDAGDSGDDSDD